MQNKLLAMIRRYDMLHPGDSLTCAVSGGADSVALLYAMFLLKEKLGIRLSAAHFNHGLRGEESDADAAFVQQLCHRLDIPLAMGSGQVVAGKKGLEAAARDARYRFFETLPGKIATAHTADDNAETVLMRLVRGTGLKGLGAIAPVRGSYIRPMLTVTRQEVLAFLEEENLTYVHDSSNDGDDFLRNRLRHHVMPLLKEENPRLAENLSAMAMRLRLDEEALHIPQATGSSLSVAQLLALKPAVRSRALADFLEANGVPEAEAAHIEAAEALLSANSPSARIDLPGGLGLRRVYDRLEMANAAMPPQTIALNCPGSYCWGKWQIICEPAQSLENQANSFVVQPRGTLLLRSRCQGDEIRLPGGSRSLKKLFIDRKIPAADRPFIPVIADEGGIVGVGQIGADMSRRATALPAVRIRIEP